MSSEKFNKVYITELKDRDFHFECKTTDGYMKHLEKSPNMVENVGKFEQQIKPVIDIDAYDFDCNIDEIKAIIQKLFPEKIINYCKREKRVKKGKDFYSYRFYVNGVRIKIDNLKKLIINNGYDKYVFKNGAKFDMSIYTFNRVLFLPLTTFKDNLTEEIPALKPIDCDIFDCCASYIKEEFEDWDLKFPEENKINKVITHIKQKDDCIFDEDDKEETYSKLLKCINHLSEERSETFEKWSYVYWCISNIGIKNGLRQAKIEYLIHQFSKISKNYNEDKVNQWIDKNTKIREASYGWNYLYNTCIKEDDPDYYNSLTKGYLTLKNNFEKTTVKILYPPNIVYRNEENEFIVQNIKSAKETYNHLVCFVKSEKKNKKTEYESKKFINIWLDDPNIKRYDKIVFKPPPLTTLPNEYNTWSDFSISSIPLIETERDYWSEYKTYCNNILGKKELVDFFLARYAYRLKYPAYRTHVCVIICGQEGDGKNKLLEPIYNIFGKKYVSSLDSAKKMYEKHSMFEKEKIFVLINEASGTANFENSDVLKARITEPTLSINPKNISPYELDNRCDYDMTTNNFNVVKISDDSYRRFLQIETTSYYKGNVDFFNDYAKNICDNQQALRQIYEGLMNFDIDAVIPTGNFQNDKPKTDIEEEVKKQNKDKIMWFLKDISEDYMEKPEILEGIVKLKNSELFTKWKEWCELNSVKIEYNSIAFGIKISQIIKKKFENDTKTYIKKDTKHSFTTLYIRELYEYFHDDI